MHRVMRWTYAIALGMSLGLVTGCVGGGGGSGGGGGGSGGGGSDPDSGCAPAPGAYTAVWNLDDDDSDDVCPVIDPSSSRFGDDDDDPDCDPGCVCAQAIREEDGMCVGVLEQECTDEDGQTVTIACALGVSGGDTTFRGRCGFDVSQDDELLAECVYDLTFTRTGE